MLGLAGASAAAAAIILVTGQALAHDALTNARHRHIARTAIDQDTIVKRTPGLDISLDLDVDIKLDVAGFRRSWCKKSVPLLDRAVVKKVKNNLAATGNDSWVSGTRMETLLELDTPLLSVYNPAYYPIAQSASIVNIEVNGIAKYWLDKLAPNATAMVEDGGAAADTASVGVGFINAAKSAHPVSDRKRYALYAGREVDYLLNTVGRMPNGAISHRPPREPPQAWDDFVYMVPPFLAYWGVINKNFSVAAESYKQIKLYREILGTPSGLWQHVTYNGDWSDLNLWGTGMAWVAAGISRTYSTLKYSPYGHKLENELADLASWGSELIHATFAQQNTTTGLLPNYYSNTRTDFGETASSALLAAAAYRLASLGVLTQEQKTIAIADSIRKAVGTAINKQTGWVVAVNPLKWAETTDKSPESMAFILLMESAARDYRSFCAC